MKGLFTLVRLLWETWRDRKQFRALRAEWRHLAPDNKTILKEANRHRPPPDEKRLEDQVVRQPTYKTGEDDS